MRKSPKTKAAAAVPNKIVPGAKYLTHDDLSAKGIRFSASHLRRLWTAEPPKFPPPIYLSERKAVWPESAVDEWIAGKIEA